MPIIKIQGVEMDVDIRGELEEFAWTRPRWTANKLIAASPFRYDKTPSFFCSLEHGGWADSGAYDAEWESGNFAKLLSFLRDETYEETVEYLFDVYKPNVYDGSGYIEINPVRLAQKSERIVLSDDILSDLAYRSPYLGRRGITEKVQRFMGVGYSKENKAVSIPWRHADGSLANVKYRRVQGKAFYYERNAAPIRTLVYGIDKVYRHDLKRVVICEAEIDAMSWYVCGVPAIALGGTTVTDTQLDLIRKSPIEKLIIAKDNDKAGGKMGSTLVNELTGSLEVAELEPIPGGKDANEALVAGVRLNELDVKKDYDKFFVRMRN